MTSSDTTIWTYVITLAVAFACLALYRTERQLVLLLTGVLGVTVAVPEAVWDATKRRGWLGGDTARGRGGVAGRQRHRYACAPAGGSGLAGAAVTVEDAHG